jgi:hypothetical protein
LKNRWKTKKHRKISILVLRTFINRLATHAEMIDDIHEAVAKIQPSEIVEVLHKDVQVKSK